MSRTKAIVSARSDAELIAASRAGDADAYAELYNRHVDGARAAARALSRSKADTDDIVAEAFSRVLSTLRRGGGPDVSFRPYLLTAVRNSFYDRTRRAKREEITDEPDDIVSLSALDAANSGEDRAMIASAFATLPERWQLVLWHTEVEGMTPAEVAPLVGLAPNAASALAYRAREGLRQAYLQSHLQLAVPAECGECAPKLGAYVRDGLAARERRRVDEHLEHCDSCRALVLELQEANNHLRAVLIPLFLGVPAAKYLAGLHASKGVVALVKHAPRRQQVAGGVASAAVAAAAAISLFSLSGTHDSRINETSTASANQAANGSAGNSSDGDSSSQGSGNSSDGTAVIQVDASGNPNTQGTSPDQTGLLGTSDTVDNGEVLDASVTSTPSTDPSRSSGAGVPGATVPGSAVPKVTVPGTTTPTTSAVATTVPSAVTPTPTPAVTPPTTPPTVTTVVPPTTPVQVDPSPLSIGIELLGPASPGGDWRVRVEVANSAAGGGAATHPVIRLNLPDGVNFSGVDTASWRCTGSANVVCNLPALPNGSTRSAVFSFNLDLTVTGSLSISGSISADGISGKSTTSADSAVTPNQELLLAAIDRGSVLAVGNTVLTCAETQSNCAAAQDGTGVLLNRQSFNMTYVNDQADLGYFNSSGAALNTGAASVNRAFLVWGGDSSVGSSTAPDASLRNMVRLTNPGGTFYDISADRLVTFGDGSSYCASADVSQIVADSGNGVYHVANLQAAEGTGSYGGWSLVVVTHDDAAPLRMIAVVTPGSTISSGIDFSNSVKLPAGNGSRDASVAVVAFEGELGLKPESVSVNGQALTNEDNPENNPFNSSVDGAAGTVNTNNFGVDVDNFETTITDNAITVEVTSGSEVARLAAVAVAVDL